MRLAAAAAAAIMLLAVPVLPPPAHAADAFTLASPAIRSYFDRHGGARTFGTPISQQVRFLGSQAQLFQRQGIELHPDGSAGTLDLLANGLLPLAVTDADVVAGAPAKADNHYLARADAYLTATAPDVWNRENVQFNSAYRASLSCTDLPGLQVCNDRITLAISLEVWGLPISLPTSDPRNPDLTYLWFQRGGLVHSRSAGRTDWLLVGQLFKNTLDDSTAAPPSHDTRFGVAEAFRDPATMADVGASWERIVLPWDDIQPRSAGDFSRLGVTFSPDRLAGELGRGVRLAAVLEATPGWAQLHPEQGKRSAPRNLDLPFDDPRNYWGNFVYQTVRHYAGQIDDWILWNEPDFRPEDPGGGAGSTWLGSAEDFAQLMKVGYLAARKANPRATVAFPATSYWADEISQPRRPQFYDRALAVLARDPAAANNGFFHDAVAVNLYSNPDDVYRVHAVFKSIQRRYGVEKPVWLTELNALPLEDSHSSCAPAQAAQGSGLTLDQQAAYVTQTVTLAAASGYQHFEFFQMADGDPCQPQQLWGLIRGDGSRRPAANALKLTISLLAGFTVAQFAPVVRDQARWPAWPDDPTSYTPNWQLYQAVFDKPGHQRVTVLWSGNGGLPLNVRVRQSGSRGWLIDLSGERQTVVAGDGFWMIRLAPASALQPDGRVDDPLAYHQIGGLPVFLIEDGVSA